MKKHILIWLTLTSDAVKALERVLPYKYEEKFQAHVTIDWDVSPKEYQKISGKKVSFEVSKPFWDEEIQAIAVDMQNSEIKSVNKYLHITWSARKGVHPFQSNCMLHFKPNSQTFKNTKIETFLEIIE